MASSSLSSSSKKLLQSLVGSMASRASVPPSVAARSRLSPIYSHLQRSAPVSTIAPLRSAASSYSPIFRRFNSDSTRAPNPLTDSNEIDPATATERARQNEARRAQEPAYELAFTCRPCGTRSSHRISHHGYHKGTVLIACPGCSSRHLISDHLKVFVDQASTLEDILARRGQVLTKGKLEGDVEWWEDGSIRSLVPPQDHKQNDIQDSEPKT